MTPVEILKNTAQELRGDGVLGAVAVEIVKEVGESILKAELERVEGMKVFKRPRNYKPAPTETKMEVIKDRVYASGYNQALADHANYIKSQIKLIEEI